MTVHGGVPGESALQHAWIPGFERPCTESASSRMESGAMDSGFIHNPRFHAALIRKTQAVLAKDQVGRVCTFSDFANGVHASRFLSESHRKRTRGTRIRPQASVSCKSQRRENTRSIQSIRSQVEHKQLRGPEVPEIRGIAKAKRTSAREKRAVIFSQPSCLVRIARTTGREKVSEKPRSASRRQESPGRLDFGPSAGA